MELRRAILVTSLKLIEKKGLDALSMRDVARRLDVTHGAPYHHFKDRSAIVAALAEDGLGILTQMLEAAAQAHSDPREAFEACGRAYVEFALSNSAYFRVIFRPELAGSENRDAIDRAAAKSFAVLAGVVGRCQAAGICTALDGGTLAITGWSTAHGLAALCLDGPLAANAKPEALAAAVGATLGTLLAHGPKSAPKTANAKAAKTKKTTVSEVGAAGAAGEAREATTLRVSLPMADGIRLDTRVFLPGGAQRVPTVLVRNPYRHVDDDDAIAAAARFHTERGYAYVWQSVRGTSRSDGVFYPYVDEVRDGVATTAWITDFEQMLGDISGSVLLCMPDAPRELEAEVVALGALDQLSNEVRDLLEDGACGARLGKTPHATSSRTARAGRNEPCPCGSGKKYKRCCIDAARPPPN